MLMSCAKDNNEVDSTITVQSATDRSTGIFSPAGHFYAVDNAHVLSVLNQFAITSTAQAVFVNNINFVDETNYSYATVKVTMSDGSSRGIFTLFRYRNGVHTSYTKNGMDIIDNSLNPGFGDGGLGIDASPEHDMPGCVNDRGCDYYGGNCDYGDVYLGTILCYCQGSGSSGGDEVSSLTILTGVGCGLDHDGDGSPR